MVGKRKHKKEVTERFWEILHVEQNLYSLWCSKILTMFLHSRISATEITEIYLPQCECSTNYHKSLTVKLL